MSHAVSQSPEKRDAEMPTILDPIRSKKQRCKEVSRCRVILSTLITSVSDSPITVTFSDSPNHSCLTRPLCPSDSADMAHPSPLVSLVEKQFRGA